MAETERHFSSPWSDGDMYRLKLLADQNAPTSVIGRELGRTEDEVYKEASKLGVCLKAPNQSTSNR